MKFSVETDDVKLTLEVPGDMDAGDLEKLLAKFFELGKLAGDLIWKVEPGSGEVGGASEEVLESMRRR